MPPMRAPMALATAMLTVPATTAAADTTHQSGASRDDHPHVGDKRILTARAPGGTTEPTAVDGSPVVRDEQLATLIESHNLLRAKINAVDDALMGDGKVVRLAACVSDLRGPRLAAPPRPP